jgi:hypothetical protein
VRKRKQQIEYHSMEKKDMLIPVVDNPDNMMLLYTVKVQDL